jgi:transposase
MKRGRPTRLNANLQNRICASLVKGSSIKSASIICGIGERTFHEWMERGENGEEPYQSFFSAATRARERHKAKLIAVVMEAADKDARHAEWLLERQFPSEFSPFDRRPVPIESQPAKPVPDLSQMVKLTLYGHPDIDVGEVIHARGVIDAYEKAMAASKPVVPAAATKSEPDADNLIDYEETNH